MAPSDIEPALLHLILVAAGAGATVAAVAARLDRMGFHASEARVEELLRNLVARGLVQAPRDRGEPYRASAAGLTQIEALEARVDIETELAELERLRTQLLGVVGHELRTPLTAIRNSVSLLQDASVRPSDVERDRLLDSIAVGAERIQRLVADVLDIARFRSGDVRLQLRTFDAAELAEAACASMRASVAQKRQHLSIELNTRPTVFGDRARLQQVLLKLLSNAHRFAPPGAAIGMTLTTRDCDVVWSITDRGPGISAEDLPRLFERFFASDDVTSALAGAGLGLPIALAIARAHGGTIEVDSTPGEGSTFSLRVPVTGPKEAEP